MSDIKFMARFTTGDGLFAHVREAGFRMAFCGAYVRISYAYPETQTPTKAVCAMCNVKLAEKLKALKQ